MPTALALNNNLVSLYAWRFCRFVSSCSRSDARPAAHTYVPSHVRRSRINRGTPVESGIRSSVLVHAKRCPILPFLRTQPRRPY